MNLEQEEGVLKEAYALFHGNASGMAMNSAVPENQRTQPAGPAGKLLGIGCQSGGGSSLGKLNSSSSKHM